MLFIKVLPSEYIKAVYSSINNKILELRLIGQKKEGFTININRDNKLCTNFTGDKTFFQLVDNEINCVTIKFNINKKKELNSEIYLGQDKEELSPIPLFENEKEKTEKNKNEKIKDEISEIILFKNFIGICTNIIIYKERKSEGLPKFLFSWEENYNTKTKQSSKDENNKNNYLTRKKTQFSMKAIFPNGIYSEELYSYFTKVELKEQVEQNVLSKNIIIKDELKINSSDFKDFFN